MIWADRQVTTAYSKVKSKLGFSDDFVSRVLAFLSKKGGVLRLGGTPMRRAHAVGLASTGALFLHLSELMLLD